MKKATKKATKKVAPVEQELTAEQVAILKLLCKKATAGKTPEQLAEMHKQMDELEKQLAQAFGY